jgi:hypothetical protein
VKQHSVAQCTKCLAAQQKLCKNFSNVTPFDAIRSSNHRVFGSCLLLHTLVWIKRNPTRAALFLWPDGELRGSGLTGEGVAANIRPS